MRLVVRLLTAVVLTGLPGICTVESGIRLPMKVIVKPGVSTAQMGGMPVPGQEVLKRMHQSGYILCARGGTLQEVPVEKTLLPHDQPMNPQEPQVDLGPGGIAYVRMKTKLCKSVDGGRTWASQPIKPPAGYTIEQTGRWKVLKDGTFICVTVLEGEGERAPARVWTSGDEGQSWEELSELDLTLSLPQTGKAYTERYCHRGLDRLQDDTLLWAIDVRGTPLSAGNALFCFRSTDGGRRWEGPRLMSDGGSEGGATRLPSGRVLATLRYQRDQLPDDPPGLVKSMGAYSKTPGRLGFKNVFLMDSDDGGQTWSPPRQLTTVFGQTFGYPAVQRNGTGIVIHDTRYGPGSPGSRAIISRDEGKSWEDEVYYLDFTAFTGSYSASVVLADDTILTIAASSQAATWEAVKNRTDLLAIRWRPLEEAKAIRRK